MKTVVLMGLSCLTLAGVFCVVNKKSQANALTFIQTLDAANPFDQQNPHKVVIAAEAITSDSNCINKSDTSNTLIDSHWLDDAAFQKALDADLLTDIEAQEADKPQQTANPESIIPVSPRKRKKAPVTEPMPPIRQLILELNTENADTTKKRAVPVEVV